MVFHWVDLWHEEQSIDSSAGGGVFSASILAGDVGWSESTSFWTIGDSNCVPKTDELLDILSLEEILDNLNSWLAPQM